MNNQIEDKYSLQDIDQSLDSCVHLIRTLLADADLNESARKEMFISYLREIFDGPEYKSRIDALAMGAEDHLKTAPSELSEKTWGFADTHNGKLVIEYKRRLRVQSNRNKGKKELRRYFASLWSTAEDTSSFCGILTDVLNWIIYQPVPSKVPEDGQYSADMVLLEEVNRLEIDQPEPAQAEHLLRLLNNVLFRENLLSLSASNLKRYLGLESSNYASLSSEITEIVMEAKRGESPALLINLWEKYQAYNAQQEEEFNVDRYVSHIYLVLLTRLLVATFIERRMQSQPEYIEDEYIESVLNGEFFKTRIRLANFVERDYFGWIITKDWITRFLPITRRIYHSLQMFDFSDSAGENILRLVYDEMMPAKQRNEFGQRSTPEQLIKRVLRKIRVKEYNDFSFLDPACGSGGFLREAIFQRREKYDSEKLSKKQQLKKIRNSVYGIDIDPVSVIISKANWTISLFDLLEYSTEPINIPVFHADSLFTVGDNFNEVDGNDIECNPTIKFDDAEIEIPYSLFDQSAAFDKLIDWSYKKAAAIAERKGGENGSLDIKASSIKDNLEGILRDTYTETIQEDVEEIASSTVELIKELYVRIREKRNGIWAFFIRNNYRPTLFAGKFNVIASNPPWLAMSHIRDVGYKRELSRYAEKYNIKPSGSAFLHTEISTTFIIHTVKHFLIEAGEAAFVLPRSIFNGDHHHEFRVFDFNDTAPIYIKRIWDLDEVDGLFKIQSFIIFVEKSHDKQNDTDLPIPANVWKDLGQNIDETEECEIELGSLGEKTAWIIKEPTIPTPHSYNHYTNLFRQGADLMPRTALFVEIVDDNPQQMVKTIQTAQEEVENNLNKVLKNKRFKGAVNKRYLFYTVTSKYLLPFIILESDLPKVVLPIEMHNGNISVLTQDELIDRGDTYTAKWFENIDKEDELGDKKIRERIDERNKLTNQDYADADYLIHTGASGGIPCAAIQTLGSSRYSFVADQTTYVSKVNNLDEAHYIVGSINSETLSKTIKAFQSKGDFGARHIHKLAVDAIPQYDPGDDRHRLVANLSETIRKKARSLVTPEMREVNTSLATRRAQLREALSDELVALEREMEKILQR